MQYKIDTKEKFDIITPDLSHFEHRMADELQRHCEQLQKNDKSAIIDFSQVSSLDQEVADEIMQMHEHFYANNLSFVLCRLSADLKNIFRTELNITPTLDEAIDIVSMEGLERELLGEEE